VRPDRAKVLVIDNEPDICAMIRDGLAGSGFHCIALTESAQAKRRLEDQDFTVMVADLLMPEVTGLDLLAYARRSQPACKVILITGRTNTQNIAQALHLGAYDYIQKPIDISQLIDVVNDAVAEDGHGTHLTMRAARAIEMESQFRHASLDGTRALARAVEAKDPYTRRHSEQVTHYAVHLARHAELTEPTTESIRIAALLHDIGKIGVPDHILTKPGPLTRLEFQQIQRHAVLGAEIVRNISMFSGEARLVRHHHERWDGQGYPDNLAGKDIPVGARIISLADSVDTMLMQRTYKAAFTVERMLDELRRCRGAQFDPELTDATIDFCQAFPEKMILPGQTDTRVLDMAVVEGSSVPRHLASD